MHRTTPRLILAGIAAAFLSVTVPAHSDEPVDEALLIRVDPVTSTDDALAVLEHERADMPGPELTVGMKAPKLEIAEWIKGDSVRHFEPGHTYVVEFWATWCTPCVIAFPHLGEIQKKYAEDVTVIGVNIWDREKNRETGEFIETMEDQIRRLTDFVDEQGDRMSYTVGVEESDKMARSWMAAAGQGGIPAAFIVDKAGKIAWIGHPGQMDGPLEEILAGDWDYEAATASHVKSLEARFWTGQLITLLTNKDTAERGYRLGYALMHTTLADDPGMLNRIAWTVLTSNRIPVRDRDMAIALATAACEKTNWENPSILDTLARGHFDKGEYDRAIELQTKAVKLAEGSRMSDDLKETLKKYETEADG